MGQIHWVSLSCMVIMVFLDHSSRKALALEDPCSLTNVNGFCDVYFPGVEKRCVDGICKEKCTLAVKDGFCESEYRSLRCIDGICQGVDDPRDSRHVRVKRGKKSKATKAVKKIVKYSTAAHYSRSVMRPGWIAAIVVGVILVTAALILWYLCQKKKITRSSFRQLTQKWKRGPTPTPVPPYGQPPQAQAYYQQNPAPPQYPSDPPYGQNTAVPPPQPDAPQGQSMYPPEPPGGQGMAPPPYPPNTSPGQGVPPPLYPDSPQGPGVPPPPYPPDTSCGQPAVPLPQTGLPYGQPPQYPAITPSTQDVHYPLQPTAPYAQGVPSPVNPPPYGQNVPYYGQGMAPPPNQPGTCL